MKRRATESSTPSKRAKQESVDTGHNTHRHLQVNISDPQWIDIVIYILFNYVVSTAVYVLPMFLCRVNIIHV